MKQKGGEKRPIAGLKWCFPKQTSKFNSLLGADAGVEGMLYLGHFGNQIGGFKQCRRRVSAGDDDMQGRLGLTNRAKLFQDLINGQKPITQDVDQFIKDQQVVISTAQLLDAKIPSRASGGAVLFGILRVPGETV